MLNILFKNTHLRCLILIPTWKGLGDHQSYPCNRKIIYNWKTSVFIRPIRKKMLQEKSVKKSEYRESEPIFASRNRNYWSIKW